MSTERRYEVMGVILLALTAFLFLALVTDGLQGDVQRPIDPTAVDNALGTPGTIAASILVLLFGHAAHVLYCVTAIWSGTLLQHRPLDRILTRIFGLALILATIACIVHIDGQSHEIPTKPGGIIGAIVGDIMAPFLGMMGTHIVSIAIAVIGILLATEFLFFKFFMTIRDVTMFTLQAIHEMWVNVGQWYAAQSEARPAAAAAKATAPVLEKLEQTELALEAAERNLADIRITRDGTEIGADGKPIISPKAPALEDAIAEADDEDVPTLEDAVASAEQDVATVESQSTDQIAEEATADIEPEPAPKPVLPSPPTPKKQKVLPRRKTWVDNALPADFEYPKRYKKPSVDMLTEPPPPPEIDLRAELEQTSRHLEETLLTFGVEARVTDVTRGPAITRFELEPGQGIKVSRFMNLADDLALALKAHRVRVEAPIPGKGRVGIEVPNAIREPVMLRELIESREFKKRDSVLNLCLGKDIEGECSVADLVSMPHLLVAGATGAGKTVGVKSMLASLLFAKTPDELQLILIDPKMVELSIFNDIPHLITPVVIDPKKAAASLNWLISEMEERYRLFAHLRTRNIEVYNESVDNGEIEMPPDDEGEETDNVNIIRKLPYIVCVIDELADLMMIARSEVEDAIARLAQLARAVGIHLVIATQRPSVDVLTGVIKANFPARMSFQVSSRVDSRCILDAIGAERLIGQGDMLYLPAGQAKPMRVQGAFVSDDEMNDLINYLKTQAPPQYKDEIETYGGATETLGDLENFEDDLFDEAVQVVLDTGQASISMVQRKLRVGYTRAARLVDMMEQKGVVGPHVGSKAREILVATPPKDEVA